MADFNPARLREQLAENYDGLVRKLTRRLGSSDYAHEALHDTFLRLDRVTDAVPVRNSMGLLLRIAVNIGKDHQKARNVRASAAEIDAVFDVHDDTPGPAQIVEARSEIEAFKRALAELPARPREVLQSVAVEGQTVEQVAARHRVSVRTVEGDLRLALAHCAERLNYKPVRRLGGPRPRGL